ncbi:4-(cytidine 5'-diphospho)-2-C-methyl-D-erythritol kinase [Hydrogenophaga sp.]|uniref:4-(cytidine 5'-diphospho)-2-C-methyl-D-erythritol kinase n=1 Tax=Hydrogenophaga sp. TaxID=1904254 RepID=UPI0019CDBA1B|nr:4-(cytidine 5'-diphospho)-2-C-methyl-D-erythritol kinase [Hydrogenophaga sp.]MBD3892895.1 4-(cytidine 5'-diphospho)-2-C-methyl-D-erythritol kinase [Hydrogenophaga sp.]
MSLPAHSAPLKGLYDLPAPAKLNLFLHVVGRRSDGYHQLQSVFMLLDWCDRLHLELRRDGGISREDLSPGELPAQDLTVRAAHALRQASGCSLGVHIGLEKHLPAQAGLGGGSSDAATCLLALNRLWGLGWTRQQLAALGLQLGADLPFFIGGNNAWVEGVGERLTPLQLACARFLVVKPPTGASTKDIFSAPDLKRDTKPARIQGFAAIDEQPESPSQIQSILNFGQNDLQAVVQHLCPDMAQCLNWLQSHGLQGRMTGSGTAVFALAQSAPLPTDAPANWTVHECSNMDAHPLRDWCCG